VIEIEVPTLELIRRLDERSKTPGCMPYDTSTAKIVKRLQEHESKTMPVIGKYNQLHGVSKIDGEGTFDEVFEALDRLVTAWHGQGPVDLPGHIVGARTCGRLCLRSGRGTGTPGRETGK